MNTQSEILEQAIESEAIPKLYFNGFINGAGNSDMIILLQSNGKPVAVLNTSFTMAKTLARRLLEVTMALEKETGNKIMETNEIEKALTGNLK